MCVYSTFDSEPEMYLTNVHYKLIPSEIKWDPNATPPQYTDNGDQVIEKGTHLRIKLIGTRSDVGSMFAIGSVKEDFLGSAEPQTTQLASVANLFVGHSEVTLTHSLVTQGG